MFAYCNNNPVNYVDQLGTQRKYFTLYESPFSCDYIYDQEDDLYKTMPVGLGTIGENGCGIIATYNAMLSLGNHKSFSEIYNYYTAKSTNMLLCGKLGIAPWVVGRYFEEQGYTVRMTDDYDEIEVLSSVADASILLYAYSGTSLGAHYVEYSKNASGYIGRNTGIDNGATEFFSVVDYGYMNSRFYAIGIFIFSA